MTISRLAPVCLHRILRFRKTAKILAKWKLKYYRISRCPSLHTCEATQQTWTNCRRFAAETRLPYVC